MKNNNGYKSTRLRQSGLILGIPEILTRGDRHFPRSILITAKNKILFPETANFTVGGPARLCGSLFIS